MTNEELFAEKVLQEALVPINVNYNNALSKYFSMHDDLFLKLFEYLINYTDEILAELGIDPKKIDLEEAYRLAYHLIKNHVLYKDPNAGVVVREAAYQAGFLKNV